ncbi:hypothetical protein HNQ60_002814 [Povalibacter uvarum]|uniref:Uncharacterized protein n=1 Tax=Povalibacter uvarum TaxID=732238 RepID=A0A841HMG0_9GAMM|nr:hypothetical protein [Povalibacter uvarum]MBB6093933.1 hypothetical protein [Povalibacter uvarum]
MTKLDRPLKREIEVGNEQYVVTLSPTDIKLTRKGHRKGIVLAWKDLLSGDAALATALNASVSEIE